jgi:hypothetical protein
VESGEWRVESGEWRVESGEWRVESGEWRVERKRALAGAVRSCQFSVFNSRGEEEKDNAETQSALRRREV